MTCTSCGTQNADGQKFCSNCGAPLTAAAQQTTTPAPGAYVSTGSQGAPVKPPKKKRWRGLVIALVIIIGVFGILMMIGKNASEDLSAQIQEAQQLPVLFDAQAFIDDSTMRPLTREQVIAMLGEPAQSDGERLTYAFEGCEDSVTYTFLGSENYDFLLGVAMPDDLTYEIEYYDNLPSLFGLETTGWDISQTDGTVFGSYRISDNFYLGLTADMDDANPNILNEFTFMYVFDPSA